MAEILGKVTGSASYEVPRGADVSLRISVPEAWFAEGRTIEVELPRNLTCARCSGGGCSACDQSGAITLRGRAELPEFVQVVLPLQRITEATEHRSSPESSVPTIDPVQEPRADSPPKSVRPVMIRIPECGGLPDAANGAIVRGWLLLEVGISETPSSNIQLLDDEEARSSSSMLRAETRATAKPGFGETFTAVAAARSSRPPVVDDDNSDPPSSRVARVGSTTPPKRYTGLVMGESELRAPQPLTGARSRAVSPAVYVGILVIAALGILALVLF